VLSVVRRFVDGLLSTVYGRLIGEEMGDGIRTFLKKVSTVGFAAVISALLVFPLNIFAGRLLGPHEYGQFGLIQSIAMFLLIPMILGYDTAMVKYASENDDAARQTTIVSSTFGIIMGFSAASIGTYWLFNEQFADLFEIEHGLFKFSVFLAIFLVLFRLSTDTLRATDRIKSFATVNPLFGISLVVSFFMFFLAGILSFKSIFFAYCIAYIVSTGVALYLIRDRLAARIDRHWATTLTRYSTFTAIGSTTFLLTSNFDRLLINKHLTTSHVGIYLAYSMASMGLADWLFRIFNAVYFPTVSRYKNKYEVLMNINRVLPYFVIASLLAIVAFQIIILNLYGDAYPLELIWVILFAVAAVVLLVDSVYGWLVASLGRHGARITAAGAIVSCTTNIGLNIVLIPILGITGAVASTIVALLAGIAVNMGLGMKPLSATVSTEASPP